MHHIHLKKCSSTQAYLLKLNRSRKEDFLVSTQEQFNGIGRREKTWQQFSSTLCFSMTLSPSSPVTLTSLEVGALLAQFFKEQDIKLKWPNDLINSQHEKCGGIIMQSQSEEVIVGIGINLYLPTRVLDGQSIGGVYSKNQNFNFKELSYKIADFIHRNRLIDIRSKWTHYCHHIGSLVTVDDTIGIFQGVSDYGEAMIEVDGKILNFSNATLRVHH